MTWPKPAPQLPIRDLKSLRVLSDPLRQRIMAQLNEQPRTIPQVAQNLEMDPHGLYYHVRLLEKHGLLREAGSRTINGIQEKSYQITAYDYVVDRHLLSPSGPDPNLDEVLELTLGRTGTQAREMVRRGVIDLKAHAPDARALLSRMHFAQISEERAAEFAGRLLELMQDFAALPTDGASVTRGHWLSVTYYPCELAPESGETTETPDEGNPS